MNTAACEGHGSARALAAILAVACAINSGCLIISWDWSGKKSAADAPVLCRSSAQASFDAEAGTVRQACRHALMGLDMSIAQDSQDGQSGTLEAAKGDKEKITVTFKPHQAPSPGLAPRTLVTVQMTTAGNGDESQQVVERIEAYLAGATAAAPVPQPAAIMQTSTTGQ